MYFDRPFTIWAIENTDLFSIHNCVEPNVDNTPQELVDGIRRLDAEAYNALVRMVENGVIQDGVDNQLNLGK